MKLRLNLSYCSAAALALAAATPNAWAQTDPKLIYYWDFNDASSATTTADKLHKNVGLLINGATYTPDAGGATGQAGDRGMDFGTSASGQQVKVTDLAALNQILTQNQISISFWQKLAAVADETAVWINSPSTPGGRAFNAHAPWSNNNIYFDTAGCCNGDTRISAPISSFSGYSDTWTFTEWHHFVFLKDGDTKRIYIDGVLFLEGTGTAVLPTDNNELTIGGASGAINTVKGVLDDVAVFGAALDESQVAALASGASPTSLILDTDKDGLPDWWEDLNGLDKAVNDAAADPDKDGLTNLQEYALGTDPNNADTDGDGLKDGVETGTGVYKSATDTGTNPVKADSDADGLADGVETNTGTYVSPTNTGTNPNVADTDGDKFGDGVEVKFDGNPLNPAVTPIKAGKANLLAWWDFNDAGDPATTLDKVHSIEGILRNGAAFTADGEGRSAAPGDLALDLGTDHGTEFVDVVDGTFANIGAVGDQLTVTFWQKLSGVSASSAFWFSSPTSNNGNRGFQAHVPWSDNTIYYDTAGCCGANTRLNANITTFSDYSDTWTFTEWHHFAFVKNGSTKQIWIDGKLFTQGSGAAPLPLDFIHLAIGSAEAGGNTIKGVLDDFAVYASALDSSRIRVLSQGGSPDQLDTLADTDGDGMPDVWEETNGLDPAVNDAALDPDNDGLTNLQEYQKKTDPHNPDTDNDGLKDGVETGTGVFKSATDTGTDPNKADTDGDGLIDSVETGTGVFKSQTDTGTNPNNPDGDNDGYPDAVEVILGSNPFDKNSGPVTAGAPNLLAFWDFNDDSVGDQTLDVLHGIRGTLLSGAAFSGDQLGHTGSAGDKAMDFGPTTAGQSVQVAAGSFVNVAGALDEMSVSLWIQLYQVAGTSAFWFESSSGGGRGFQAHVPWSNNNIYFDTAGCCDAPTRINAPINSFSDYSDTWSFTTWHHYVFVKNHGTKQVWIDGKLFIEGAGAAPLPKDFGQFRIGSDSVGNGSIQGIIDDFAIFASALTPDQISEIAGGVSPKDIKAGDTRPTLSLSNTNGKWILTWTGNLESSDSVGGTWSPVANATSPLELTTSDAQRFYRARQ